MEDSIEAYHGQYGGVHGDGAVCCDDIGEIGDRNDSDDHIVLIIYGEGRGELSM